MANLKGSIVKRLRAAADQLDPEGRFPARKASPIVEPPPPEPVIQPPPEPPPRPPAGIGRFMDAEPLAIEVEASPEDLQRLIDLTSAIWTKLGEEHAHWSVLTWPEFLQENFDQELFYRTGQHDTGVFFRFLRRAGLDLPSDGTMLELGCGVGRLTRHFAPRFRTIHAVDISRPHLDLAGKQLQEAGFTNVQLVQLTRPGDLDALPDVDLFYSIIVLQHNPPPVAYNLLARCLRRVRPGGLAYFQIPTYSLGYSFSVANYVQDPFERMEMHVVPQGIVLKLLRELGFDLLEVQEDPSAGDGSIGSHTFFARRRSA